MGQKDRKNNEKTESIVISQTNEICTVFYIPFRLRVKYNYLPVRTYDSCVSTYDLIEVIYTDKSSQGTKSH